MKKPPLPLRRLDTIVNQAKLRKPQTRYFKKVQHDATSAYLYALGCSLVHFTLFVTMFIVVWPDLEKAKAYDDAFKP